jgi:hypothetical protein
MRRRSLLPATVMILAAAAGLMIAPRASSAREGGDKTPWKIVGQLEEGCSCSKACPCWFDSKPTKMNCSGNQILFLEKGNYGNVKLDGLALANYVQSPDGKGMMESFGHWNMSYLYLDDRATPEQRKALEAIGNTVFPMAAAPADKRMVRNATIKRTITGKTHKIDLGQYGAMSAHLIEGGLGGSVKISNPPGADPLHKEYLQGETESYTYTDGGQNWSFSGSNYMFGTFELDNVMYEKFTAGLAQKMAAQPK